MSGKIGSLESILAARFEMQNSEIINKLVESMTPPGNKELPKIVKIKGKPSFSKGYEIIWSPVDKVAPYWERNGETAPIDDPGNKGTIK